MQPPSVDSKSIMDEINVRSANYVVKPAPASRMPGKKTAIASCALLLLCLLVTSSVLILIIAARVFPELTKIAEMHTLITTAVENFCKLPDTTDLCRNLTRAS